MESNYVGRSTIAITFKKTLKASWKQSVMLSFLLQDKLFLVAHSTPEKITLHATTLGKLSPVKAQQNHSGFVFVST